MGRILSFILAALAGFQGTPAGAGEPDYAAIMAEADWDWRPGDFIFRNGINADDGVLRDALGLKWESVGLLRASSGGPRVVYVDQLQGVTEKMLYVFVDGLSARDYAVYRLRDSGTAGDRGARRQEEALLGVALSVAYGAPYDGWFLLGDGAFYNAELAYLSALNAGVVPGGPVPLGDLVPDPEGMAPGLRALLEDHRYCRYALTFETCWKDDLAGQAIVTTDVLIGSGILEQVFP